MRLVAPGDTTPTVLGHLTIGLYPSNWIPGAYLQFVRYDGTHEGAPYFALEYVDGQSLDQKLRLASQTAPEAARIVQTLALAVEHAHSMGVVHRDLKPANVMLDGRGKVRLADFGLASAAGEAADVRSGTAAYQAPELLARFRASRAGAWRPRPRGGEAPAA